MKFNITTSYQKMFLYFYPVLYSQRELMPTLIVFHSKHRHPNFSNPKKPGIRKIGLVEKLHDLSF
jgi:hypothetical protein